MTGTRQKRLSHSLCAQRCLPAVDSEGNCPSTAEGAAAPATSQICAADQNFSRNSLSVRSEIVKNYLYTEIIYCMLKEFAMETDHYDYLQMHPCGGAQSGTARCCGSHGFGALGCRGADFLARTAPFVTIGYLKRWKVLETPLILDLRVAVVETTLAHLEIVLLSCSRENCPKLWTLTWTLNGNASKQDIVLSHFDFFQHWLIKFTQL